MLQIEVQNSSLSWTFFRHLTRKPVAKQVKDVKAAQVSGGIPHHRFGKGGSTSTGTFRSFEVAGRASYPQGNANSEMAINV